MNCDRIAPYYQPLEYLTLGRALEKRRFAYLEQARNSRRALLCGGGDGRFLARLLQANPRVTVDYAELSRGMVRIAKARVARLGASYARRVRFHVGDLRHLPLEDRGYDLIVTHFFLDCFADRELAPLVKRLASSASADARWIVSEFCHAEGVLGRAWTRTVTSALYAAFRVTTNLRVGRLPDYTAALSRAGFRLDRGHSALGGLLHSSVWRPEGPADWPVGGAIAD